MTWALIPLILPIFFTRDFFLLRMGPRSKRSIRLGAYSLILLATVISVPAFSSVERASLEPLMAAIMCLYAALGFLSILARKTNRHDLAWLLAAAPNPVLALGLSRIVTIVLPRGLSGAFLAGTVVAACIWIALTACCVKRADHTPMKLPDLDFSLTIAAVVNSAAMLTLVI